MPPWHDSTVYQALSAVADRGPERAAVVADGDKLTYRELVTRSQALAAGLDDLGIGAGDRVAVWLGNRPEWIEIQLAAAHLGASLVAVNTRYRSHELEYLLEDSGAVALVTEGSFLGNNYLKMIADLAPSLREADPVSFSASAFPALEHVVTLSDADDFPGARAYDEIPLDVSPADAPDPTSDPTVSGCVFYTSGTTSDPKGCPQTNRALLNHPNAIGRHLDVTSDHVLLGALPFCGIWGHNVFMTALAHGSTLVIQSGYDPDETVELVERHRVTHTSMLASMYVDMIESSSFDEGTARTLRRGVITFVNIGLTRETFERIEDAVGVSLVQPYGLSEGGSQIFLGDPGASFDRRFRVGGPLVDPAHEEVGIFDPETGEPLPAGTVGEICLRGYNVVDEYLDKPAATEAAIDDDGWLHTGDLGAGDEADRFYYRSRMDDALRVQGFLVAPREIEQAVEAVDGVNRAQVVGAPHPTRGQVPVAFVKQSGDLTADGLRGTLDGRIADYKLPERIVFLDRYPRTDGPHGKKIQKNELRERVADWYVDE